jgi:hypothetical protein
MSIGYVYVYVVETAYAIEYNRNYVLWRNLRSIARIRLTFEAEIWLRGLAFSIVNDLWTPIGLGIVGSGIRFGLALANFAYYGYSLSSHNARGCMVYV